MINIELAEQVHQFSSNTYIISSNNEYAVIDPSVPFVYDGIKDKVKYILLTHSHFDHILDIDAWVSATGAQVLVSSFEIDFLGDPEKNCYALFLRCDKGYHGEAKPLYDGDVLPFGDTEIRVMATPGHTVGSVCYLCDGVAFVGDTVFAGGGYGRWDLPSGNYAVLKESIEKIKALPCDTILYPGHGGSTTVLQYKKDFTR